MKYQDETKKVVGNTDVYEEKHSEDEDDHSHYISQPIYPVRTPYSSLSENYNRTTLFPRDKISHIYKRRYSTTTTSDKKKVAVVLSGCGVYDGSEIHEAVSVLVHLSRAGVEARCFAPDIDQSNVINHVKGAPSAEGPRNVLTESARIARGKIKPLSALQSDTYSAVIFPGGYGAAKNLCTFATQGEHHVVQPEVQRVIKEFHDAKKPIGLLCVAPVIVAKLIPGVSVTLGNEDKDIDKAIEKMGSKAVPLGVLEVNVDSEHNVITSPAYMTNSPIHKVYDGIGKFVDTVLSVAK